MTWWRRERRRLDHARRELSEAKRRTKRIDEKVNTIEKRGKANRFAESFKIALGGEGHQ